MVRRETVSVHAEWDSVSRCWTATSNDVPGLVTESETFEGLIERIGQVLPELLLPASGGTAGADASSNTETLRNIRVMVHADREVRVSA